MKLTRQCHQHNGELWVAVKLRHVKPGKGSAFAQIELKNLINGSKLNERFRSADKVERVRLEQTDYQFLYESDDMLVFMDTESYEQIELQAEFVGDRAAFLQDGMNVVVESHEGKPIGIRLPDQVTLEVNETEAVVKGQTAAIQQAGDGDNGGGLWCRPLLKSVTKSSSTPMKSPI